MGDSYLFPVALTWDQGPESLKKLKTKLLLYFSTKSKSDGGECQLLDTDCSRGHILIHFKEETARDRVLKKNSHELSLPGGKKLPLKVQLPDTGDTPSTPPAPPSQDVSDDGKSIETPDVPVTGGQTQKKEEVLPGVSSSLVLIENIQDSYSTDTLNLLVENVSGKEEGMDFHVERILEIQSAVVTFTCDIDISGFIGKCAQNSKMKQQSMAAKTLEETRCIRVDGLLPNTPEDMVSLYFESTKNGGGSVESTEMIPDEAATLVTFQNAKVVKTVLEKPHVIQNKTVSVYPYYPSIKQWLYGKKGLCPAIPDPVEVPIFPAILELITSRAKIQQSLEKQMADHYCEVKWPDPRHPRPVIILSVSSNLDKHSRTLARIAPTWSTKAKNVFSLLLSKYKVVDHDMSPPVWEAIKGTVSLLNDEVLIKPSSTADKVYIAGISEDVDKIDPTFRKLVEETDRELNKMEDCVPLDPADYNSMSKFGLEKNLQKMFAALKITYDAATKTIKLIGPKDEVLAAKRDILKTVQDLKSRTVNLDPHVIQFLMSTDNEKLSCNLLKRNNIKAILQVEGQAVTLTGYSDIDLARAEDQVKKELVCKRISIENKAVTQIPEWKNLQTFMMETYNSAEKTVVIEEYPVGNGIEVVISGLSLSAEDTYQQMYDFVEKNTLVQKDIKIKSVAVLKFLEEKQMDDITNNVKVEKKQNFISLSGPKLYVERAEALLKKIISGLYSDTLYIDEPGAKKFSIDNEEMYNTTVKNQFNCFIHLQKDGDGRSSHQETSKAELLCQVNLQIGAIIALYKGDICNHSADAIIIESNEDLKPTGGPALAILQAAGPKIQNECDHVIQTGGNPRAGEAVMTDAGNLPCKKLIHAVGPKWRKKSDARILRKTITSSLEAASDGNLSSVALSVGDFVYSGCPVEDCSENIINAIKHYMANQHRASTIKSIHLVDKDDRTLKELTESIKNEFEEEIVQVPSKRGGTKKHIKKNPKQDQPISKSDGQMVSTKEGLNIRISQGNVQDATSNVIVNSVGKELDLRYGAVSKALLTKGGNKLQDLIDAERRHIQVEDGSLLVTDGCNLSCDLVFHVVVPNWESNSSEKIARNIINNCLRSTEEKRMRSITIPAIGTGALGFPKNTVANLMFEEILDFSSKTPPQHLKEVTIMLHPNDTETIKAFSKELENKSNISGTQKKDNKAQPTIGAVKSPAQNIHEMRVGSVNFRVKTGDITKETCDVIINSTNNTFNLKAGVSKAILEAAGPNVEAECALQAANQPNTGYAITSGGNLSCKNILHIHGQPQKDPIKKAILNGLHECEKLQAKSAVLPAMGTGAGGAPAPDVADAILEAVEELVKSTAAPIIQSVTVVLFQPPMLNDFLTSMKKKEASATTATTKSSSSFFKTIFQPVKAVYNYMAGKSNEGEKEEEEEKALVFELRENIEPAIFHLCAERPEDVKNASDWLKNIITKQHHENIIEDFLIEELEGKDRDTLAKLQRQHGVSINVDIPKSAITVRGLTSDVLKASIQIQDMIRKAQEQKAREREADLCSQVVQWGYYDGTNFIPFDKMNNLDLEKARKDARQCLNIDIQGVKYTVVAEGNTASDARGNKLTLTRIQKNEMAGVPDYWDPMDGAQVKVVPVAAGTKEYNEVTGLFAQTCLMKTVKIERIQNKSLYENYQIKKNSMDTKNGPGCSNERRLFHGTDAETTKKINHTGFNRSYTQKQKLGKGSYFAVDANYSASDDFSKPDSNGNQYMYLARVLTGIFCKGNEGMVVPSPRNPANPADLCDSAADHETNPSVFAIFNDVSAYPEYLITFRK